MPVKLGLVLKTSWSGGEAPPARIAAILAQLQTARDAGFESVWLAQHFLSGPERHLQTIPLLGRLAPELGGLRIGTSIMLLPMLNPVLLAEEMATLDWLADGRLMLGVGLGYIDREYAAMQTPKAERVGRFAEAIEVMRRLWSGGRITHEGRYFPLRDVEIGIEPKQPGGPPILIGASVDAAVKRAARIGDGWLVTFATGLPEVARQLEMYSAERAAAGLPPPKEQSIGRECYVGATMKEAMADAGGPLLGKYEAYRNLAYTGLREGQVAEQGRAFMQGRFLIGDTAFVRDEMQRYRETLGVDLFRLRMEWDGLAQDKVLRSIECLGRAAEGVR
ncbi:MAG: LLM class flavin-dependent oxidoreductase [Alphaproteobacteria bacterium]|nr:LLM class flavin-dependent oxidoreductase [Alphaproteobacteria bacterium]